MSYVLQRTDQGGGYVAPPGLAKSYTPHRCRARRFATVAEAEADRCVDNERIVPL